MHPALFYRPGERLSLTELSAARLDGHVIEIGEGYMPADTVESSADRAVSISMLLSPRTAASGATAAWVHGAGDLPPSIHHVTRIGPSRPRTRPSVRVVHHDRTLASEEVQLIGGVPVTTPVVTAVTLLFDLARHGGDDRWLRALLLGRPDLTEAVRAHVASIERRPGCQTARRILAEMLADQEVVTR
ncbi:SAM-dependent methyltransferase [Microbacterium alcoholitolerans]|uniref:SAM-dependent methyltransferase n=1 Tax=unclassified Microbacterium TaxID=2609290 RepID=UPI003D182048